LAWTSTPPPSRWRCACVLGGAQTIAWGVHMRPPCSIRPSPHAPRRPKAASALGARASNPNPPQRHRAWTTVGQAEPENAAAAAQWRVRTELGPHRRATFLAAHTLVLSPGVPPTQADVAAAAAAGVRVLSELEFAYQALPPGLPIAAVTGTNGKSTVTTFTGQLLSACNLRTFVGAPPAAVFPPQHTRVGSRCRLSTPSSLQAGGRARTPSRVAPPVGRHQLRQGSSTHSLARLSPVLDVSLVSLRRALSPPDPGPTRLRRRQPGHTTVQGGVAVRARRRRCGCVRRGRGGGEQLPNAAVGHLLPRRGGGDQPHTRPPGAPRQVRVGPGSSNVPHWEADVRVL